jgi:hypothetical protein
MFIHLSSKLICELIDEILPKFLIGSLQIQQPTTARTIFTTPKTTLATSTSRADFVTQKSSTSRGNLI